MSLYSRTSSRTGAAAGTVTGKKKVLWVIKGLGLGGAEKLLVQALPYLDRERFDYEAAYFLPWKNALVQDLEKAGVPVFCLDQRRPFDPRGLYRLARLIRQRRPDVVHAHLPYAGIMGRLATRLAPVPAMVYTEHNLFERYHRLTALVHRWTYSWSDATICVSEAVQQSAEAKAKVKGKTRLQTIRNGVDWHDILAARHDPAETRAELAVPPADKVVVHVASFTPKKRHEDLLHAARLLLDEQPDVTFLLVGDGPLRTEMEARARELGVEHKVRFLGHRLDAVRIMAAGDLFVLPSLYEGLPISLLEAMAVGRPAVATRVGAIPEVVTEGVNGLLVEPCDPPLLAASMRQVLNDPVMQERFSRNAVQRVTAEFGIDVMVRSVERLYEDVLRDKGGIQ
jgi:glycosyltransferase involved in cell wall biosynthesis